MSIKSDEVFTEPEEGFQARVDEHGHARAVLESFAYLPPWGALFKKSAPLYAESYWYCMGGSASSCSSTWPSAESSFLGSVRSDGSRAGSDR